MLVVFVTIVFLTNVTFAVSAFLWIIIVFLHWTAFLCCQKLRKVTLHFGLATVNEKWWQNSVVSEKARLDNLGKYGCNLSHWFIVGNIFFCIGNCHLCGSQKGLRASDSFIIFIQLIIRRFSASLYSTVCQTSSWLIFASRGENIGEHQSVILILSLGMTHNFRCVSSKCVQFTNQRQSKIDADVHTCCM